VLDSLSKPKPDYTLRPEWKEMLWYSEGENHFCFQCGWGVSPGYIYVPPAADWDVSVPPFLRGRRDEIIARLRTFDNSHIDEMSYGPYKGG
jgi:hypothetical protein